MMKVTDAASAYKVPAAERCTSLFKTPTVEEEIVKQVGNIHPLAINPDLRRALEISFESSMAAWMAHDGYDHLPVQSLSG